MARQIAKVHLPGAERWVTMSVKRARAYQRRLPIATIVVMEDFRPVLKLRVLRVALRPTRTFVRWMRNDLSLRQTWRTAR